MGRKSIERARKPLTEKTKRWVIELLMIIQDKDLDQLTLDDLSTLVGKSKSTIYSYFSTKEEIFQTGVELILDEFSALTTPAGIEGDNMESVLQTMLLKLSEGLEGISIRFLEQIQRLYPDVWNVIEEFTDKLLANFERVYLLGMHRGTFRQFNLSLLLALDRHFVMSIMTDAERFEDQKLSLNDLVKEYLELRLTALRIA